MSGRRGEAGSGGVRRGACCSGPRRLLPPHANSESDGGAAQGGALAFYMHILPQYVCASLGCALGRRNNALIAARHGQQSTAAGRLG